MITLKELNPHNYTTTPEEDKNLDTLLDRLSKVRESYGEPMLITSGLRSDSDQEVLIVMGKSNAPKSRHLTGEAADVYDPQGLLKSWVESHIDLIEQLGLWMEDFAHTPTWVHFQIVPPKSGKRFFIP